MASSVAESAPAAVTERRISWLTLLIGLARRVYWSQCFATVGGARAWGLGCPGLAEFSVAQAGLGLFGRGLHCASRQRETIVQSPATSACSSATG